MTKTLDHTGLKPSNHSILNLAKEVFEIEANSIIKLIEKLGEPFIKAIDILYSCKGRIIITGMGKSGLIGKKIASTLSSTGSPSYFLHPAESTHGDSGLITKEDIVIAISNSGETDELLYLLPIIKRLGVKLIGLTGGDSSSLAQKADVTLDISVEKEACPLGKAPTASTTATLAMGDALAVCLLHKRGFTSEDFLLYHPSGSLGKGILYTVEELMKQQEELPLITKEDFFQDAIREVSQKGLGVAIITDNTGGVEGILTDGDIRRAVLKYENIGNLTVKDVMTKNPKVISPQTLAAEALQIMETYSITSLVVADTSNKPKGIIHIHDLLKAGVA